MDPAPVEGKTLVINVLINYSPVPKYKYFYTLQMDYTIRMYDFQGMNSKLQSFRQLEPCEGHQVRSLSWSPTSDRFLCVTGSAQAKVFWFAIFLESPKTVTPRNQYHVN